MVAPESRIMVYGVMDISTSFKKHENEEISDSWKAKVNNYQFPVNLNIPTELLALPIFEIVGKNRLADPKSVCCHMRSQIFFMVC